VNYLPVRKEGYIEQFNSIIEKEPMCIRCRGVRMLCGKARCPIMVKVYADSRSVELTSREQMDGISPPGIFIGRIGYPRVDIGPFITPAREDAALMDTPERWKRLSIEQIANMRYSLVRGKHSVRIDESNEDRVSDIVREISMASSLPSIELKFSRAPSLSINSDDVQPFGRSGRIEKIRAGNFRLDHHLQRVYHDTDLKAGEAVVELYERGALISSIQRAFSAGTMGLEKKRKMVPTRWSITAVDTAIGNHLLSINRYNRQLEEFRVYTRISMDNRWFIILLPTSWRYELVEAWYPRTTWNPFGSGIQIYSSHEFFSGRNEYAEIGGCYYAARLAVNELFRREGVRGGAVILRETHPGYIMPVGVWNVRENVREALNGEPFRFETFEQVLSFATNFLEIPVSRWIESSAVMKDMIQQRRIEHFASIR